MLSKRLQLYSLVSLALCGEIRYGVRDILSQNNEDYTETVVYQLTEGCVRLEAVIQHTGSVSFLGYDMYVKSTPTDSEWIAYDVLTQPVNIVSPYM